MDRGGQGKVNVYMCVCVFNSFHQQHRLIIIWMEEGRGKTRSVILYVCVKLFSSAAHLAVVSNFSKGYGNHVFAILSIEVQLLT